MNLATIYQENHEVIVGGAFTIIGVLTGWLLNLIQSYFQNKKEQKVYLKEKREEVYLKVLDVLMRHEKCYREKRVDEKEYEAYKETFNDLQSYVMVYASPKIYKEYYKLCNDTMLLYSKFRKRKDREEVSEVNLDKIENFANKIRRELGVKGDVTWQ